MAADTGAVVAALATRQVDGWWSELDAAVLACVNESGGMRPEEIGRRLGMSAAAAVSVLGMLAHEGRVRIVHVEAVP